MTSPRLYNCRCIRNPEIIPNRSSGMYGRTITATATGPTPPARPQTIRAVLSRSTCDRVAVTYSYISDYWSRATFTFAGQEAANGLEDKQPAKPSNFHSTSIKKKCSSNHMQPTTCSFSTVRFNSLPPQGSAIATAGVPGARPQTRVKHTLLP